MAVRTRRKNKDYQLQVEAGRQSLSSDIRTSIMHNEPDTIIFDAMDQADAIAAAIPDNEIIDAMVNQGLVWVGKYWTKRKFVWQFQITAAEAI